VLLAGDLVPPLDGVSRVVAAVSGESILGAACRFDGFAIGSATVSCDDADLAGELLERVEARGCLLAVSADQPVPTALAALPWTEDSWLVAHCTVEKQRAAHAEPAMDVDEVEQFYHRVGARFWCRAMFDGGRVFVARAGAEIVAAVAVQFVLPRPSYAHIGALATDPLHRSAGLATSLLSALRSALASRGIARCGVFADASHPWLADFYRTRGFTSQLRAFRFATWSLA
jgi:GNAT superfamily N-acetyltransferase